MNTQNRASYNLHQGTNFRAYEYLGAHKQEDGAYVFRVFAPRAESVALVGDFCSWDVGVPMRRVTDGGVWETQLEIGRVREGHNYKFKIAANGESRYVPDPYAFATERLPKDASVICDIDAYSWRDGGWIAYKRRSSARGNAAPLNIYFLDLGAWRKRWNGESCSYTETAAELAPYVKQMGYTHVALTPVMEHTQGVDEGFDVRAYFAPTALYGSPADFMAFVDGMHEAGIGVILQLPFSLSSESALCRFDGQPLYETRDALGVRFDLSRGETECLLASSTCFWIEKYHADGLLIDGVCRLVRPDGDASPKATAFFRELNAYLAGKYPDVVTFSLEDGEKNSMTEYENSGLGFGTVRNVGWTNHTILCAGDDPHSKTRATLGCLMTDTGAKLTFMGTELGRTGAWDRTSSIDWGALEREENARLQLYAAELGRLYLTTPCLWNGEMKAVRCPCDGLTCFERTSGKDGVTVVINFTPDAYKEIRLGVSKSGEYIEIFNSDDGRYGGGGETNRERLVAYEDSNGEFWINTRISPLAITIFKRVADDTQKDINSNQKI